MQIRFSNLDPRYLGIIAAIISFGSWATSNFVTARAQRSSETAGAIRSGRFMDEWQRTVSDRLNRIHIRMSTKETIEAEALEPLGVNPGIRRRTAAESRRLRATRQLERSNLSAQQFEVATNSFDLWHDLAQRSEYQVSLAQRLGVNNELAVSATALRDSIAIYWKVMRDGMDVYMKSRDRAKAQNVSGSLDSDSYLDSLVASDRKMFSSAAYTWSAYEPLAMQLDARFMELQDQAEVRRARWEVAEVLATWLALCMYILGAILAVLGKWLEVRAGKSGRGPTA